MVSTIILLLLIVLCTFIGARRGAARMLLSLAAAVVNVVLSNMLAQALAQMIYRNFIQATVLRNIEQFIAENGERFASENSLRALPDGLEGIIGAVTRLFGVTPADLQGRIVASTAHSEQAVRTIEAPLGALATAVLSVLLMLVFLIIFGVILRVIAGKLALVFELPVIGSVNRVLGCLLGAAEGLLVSFALANIVYLLMSYANPTLAENKVIFGGLFNWLLLFR